MKIEIPDLSLVVLIGAAGSGKSTFAKKHFLETEVLSSDFFRGLVSDDPTDQAASEAAFEALYFITEKRLATGKLTVIDATNINTEGRQQLIQIAKKHHVMLVGIIFDLPESICQTQNLQRERSVPAHVVKKQVRRLKHSKKHIQKQFRYCSILRSSEEADQVSIERIPLKVDRRQLEGSFDVIGDVHGCFTELCMLLGKLGYQIKQHDQSYEVHHSMGRKVIFVGDLVDRGPNNPEVVQLVMDMVESGIALSVCGNHDERLVRKLSGRNVELRYGLENTLEQFAKRSEEWQQKVYEFLKKLPHHYVLDQGRLVVAHAGLIEEYHGRSSGKVRSFALYGDTTGEKDEYGFPIRRNWAEDYQGDAFVVYGHTPVVTPVMQNGTVNIDTGCVFGGKLTAFRYPEQTFVSVPAQATYADFARPLFTKEDFIGGTLPSMNDVYGDLQITTRFHSPIRIFADQSAAALEIISRYAIDPQWLIYLPPTMSPSETTTTGEYLEYPHDAFRYYQENGVQRVICEEKHMGSRAVVIVCQDENVAEQRFGIKQKTLGICYTRTGRRFFDDHKLEQQLLKRLQQALTQTGFWEKFDTDWVCLDTELMPWSAKAQQLLKDQYAAMGSAARFALTQAVKQLERSQANGREVDTLLQSFQQKKQQSEQFTDAYRRYCWSVKDLEDYRLAPFHVLATEGKVHYDHDHLWHMETIREFCDADPSLLMTTDYRVVDLGDNDSIETATHWWEEFTQQGGEGMVVKPIDFLVRQKRGLLQPAIKCRGREYLRIIYGPEYTTKTNLQRLRKRGLKKKRSLAIREFALGLEALERFVNKDPLRQVHQCSFGILALESEPVDPRL